MPICRIFQFLLPLGNWGIQSSFLPRDINLLLRFSVYLFCYWNFSCELHSKRSDNRKIFSIAFSHSLCCCSLLSLSGVSMKRNKKCVNFFVYFIAYRFQIWKWNCCGVSFFIIQGFGNVTNIAIIFISDIHRKEWRSNEVRLNEWKKIYELPKIPSEACERL